MAFVRDLYAFDEVYGVLIGRGAKRAKQKASLPLTLCLTRADPLCLYRRINSFLHVFSDLIGVKPTEFGIEPSEGYEVNCTEEELAQGKDAILDFAIEIYRKAFAEAENRQ